MSASLWVDGRIEQRYEILRHIGSGAYGVVWCARDRTTGESIAIKKVFDAFGNQQDAQRTYREVMLLCALRDSYNVVNLLNVIRSVNGLDLYLVFELSETDLTVILRKNVLKDVHQRYICYQVVKTVALLHGRKVIHRDIKPSNIFVDSNCEIKLGDFGLARTFGAPFSEDGKLGMWQNMTEYIATRWYRSPENLGSSTEYTTSMDMWAVGCVIAEIMLGKPLFSGASTLDQLELIVSAIGRPTRNDVQSLKSDSMWSLIESLPAEIECNPLDQQLECCDTQAVDLIRDLLVFNPAKRLTAIEALQYPYIAVFVTSEDYAQLEKCTPVTLPLSDYTTFSSAEYRDKLYESIVRAHRYGIDTRHFEA